MKKEIFYEILDIEHPGDFQYFDNIAELFETSEDVEIDDEMKERINYLVSHHHTYTNVDGMDYRILLEADFLVNADESEMSENAVETARERVFETNTGKKLLTSIYKLPAR